MCGKAVKSEHERIRDLEDQIALVQDRLDTLTELSGGGRHLGTDIRLPGLIVTPTAAVPRFLSSGSLFAITPLPRTISQGSGQSNCGTATTVHNVTGAANLVCVVENAGRRCDVRIELMRAGAVLGQSPLAAAGNTVSFGPIAAAAGDVIQVVCAEGGSRCEFNFQINQAP